MRSVAVAEIGVVILLVLLALVVITRYKVAGPSEAFIVTGTCARPCSESDRFQGLRRHQLAGHEPYLEVRGRTVVA